MGAGRAFGQLPVVAEEHLEVGVVPGGRRGGPGAFEAAGDRVVAAAGAVAIFPAEALRLEGRSFRLGADMARGGSAVGLAEGVAAGHEGDGLLVVHRHPGEGFADVAGGSGRIGYSVGPLRIDVAQAHLDGGERIGQLPITAVALVPEPGLLRPPVGFVGLPGIDPASAEAEGRKAHRFQRHVAGEHEEIGPRNLPAVLLLDRPEEPARLVEIGVVGPAVEGRKPLHAGPRAAAAVGGPVGSRTVPGHAEEERPVVAIVGRPPGLRRGHERAEIGLEGGEVEGFERCRIIESSAHRVDCRRILLEDPQREALRPPLAVRRSL